MITTMTQKRQVTIAKALCDQVGLAPGQAVQVQATVDGKIVIEAAAASSEADGRVARVKAALERFAGAGADGEGTDLFIARIREPLP